MSRKTFCGFTSAVVLAVSDSVLAQQQKLDDPVSYRKTG